MGKKKHKKSPQSKTPRPSSSSPPAKSPPPPKPDSEDLSPCTDVEVSDAPSGSPATEDAQLPRDTADLSPQLLDSPPEVAAIDKFSSDPPSVKEVEGNNLLVLSSTAPSLSSPVSLPVEAEATQAIAIAESNVDLAVADAKVASLGSQQADAIAASPSVSNEVAATRTTEADSEVPVIPEAVVNSVSVPTASPAQSEPIANSDPVGTEHVKKVTPKETVKDSWCDKAKGVKHLSKKGEAFTLPSGEACVKIPNSVIEKNRKSWEPFVLGQFYSDPPSQGTLHNIVNGIWSKQYRDIAVSKMEGFSFLFRIPNAATRNRVIKQKLWQIEGQTMFVDNWEPGIIPSKPELTSAPIWLELRNVPLQFFNEDGLERIAGLVGQPKFLHPATANKTNLEVAKVFTIIDPRKPLPEAVNVQFDSGVISRVLVSSPWMPPVCGFCKEIGHSTRRCPSAPKPCSVCNSLEHNSANCPKAIKKDTNGRKTRRSRSRNKHKWVAVDNSLAAGKPAPPPIAIQEEQVSPSTVAPPGSGVVEVSHHSKLGSASDKVRGEASGSADYLHPKIPRSASFASRSSQSEMQPDSSDIESSDYELEEGEFSKHEPDFEVVRNRKRSSGQKGTRSKGSNLN